MTTDTVGGQGVWSQVLVVVFRVWLVHCNMPSLSVSDGGVYLA